MDKDKLLQEGKSGGGGQEDFNPMASKYPKPDTGFGKKNGLDLDIY